jgi:trehalose utilization protein
LNAHPSITAGTATLQEPDHGLPVDRLTRTDVLLWWGHAAHRDVDDAIVENVAEAVWSGMGLIVLHSGHFSKIFKRLMGTPCNLSWREAGERERVWITAPNHPIATGLPPFFELENEEMYSEPFGIPEPDETIMIGWFQGGEVFRSGVTFRRGAGRIFYFQPGHETYPTYHKPTIQQILRNAVVWAHNPAPRLTNVTAAPNRPAEEAPEGIKSRGPRLHRDGEEGLR